MEIFWPLVRSVYFLLEGIFAEGGRLARGRVLFRSCCRVVVVGERLLEV